LETVYQNKIPLIESCRWNFYLFKTSFRYKTKSVEGLRSALLMSYVGFRKMLDLKYFSKLC